MGKNANFVSHKKSKLKENGGPKLPLASDIVEGEIAINFGKNVETLSIKNESGDVVTFSSDNYYTEKKLGSGFTGENSGVTVTEAIQSLDLGNEVEVNSGDTPTGQTIELWVDESFDPVIADVYTKAETDTLLEGKLDASAYTPTDLSNYYTKSETSGATEISTALADKLDTSAYTELWVSGTGLNSVVLKGSSGTASGDYSVAEGESTTASGSSSHAEGSNTKANGNYGSHAEGYYTEANGTNSHAEGSNTKASGHYGSHAEGSYTVASGWSSHAEGNLTTASGNYSHAEGTETKAYGYGSHAEGNSTITNNRSEHASGQYNVSSSASTTFGNSGNTLFSVGNGTSVDARHNAFEIRQNGDIYITSGNSEIKLQDNLGGNITVDQVLDDTTSASTNPVSSKAVYKVVTDNELVWTNAFVALSGTVSAHTENTDIHVTAADKTAWANKIGYAEYDSNDKKINFYKNDTDTATSICYIDATDFIKDGMVSNVEIKDVTSGGSQVTCLVISFNTDAGKQDINIPLSQIFDPSNYYTKTEVDERDLWVSGTGVNSVVLKGSSGRASGDYSVAEGYSYEQYGETYTSIASGSYSHTEGVGTNASGDWGSHAEGYNTTANGDYGSHAEGDGTVASGDSSHAEGSFTEANGLYSHAEGDSTTASSQSSHAEGRNTVASGHSSHAEGNVTTASGDYSHSEGYNTTASGNRSHAEGEYTEASGSSSHAEGRITIANGDYSHAEGLSTIANNVAEHASGQYNVSNSASTTFGDSGNTLFSVGNGTANDARRNAFEIRQNGDIYIVSGNSEIKLQDNIGKVETVTAITPGNSGSTAPIATSVVAENELTVSNALTNLNTIITAHTTDTNVHFTANDRLKWETLNRRTRKNFTDSGMTYFTNTLKSAIADQDLEKYGMKVGDYCSATNDGKTYNYVIAGLNTMRGTVTPYRLNYDHVGIIVDTNDTHAWNTSNSTATSQNTHNTDGTWTTGTAAAGYASCDLQYYLETTVLPNVESNLGSDNIKSHYKLYSNAVNTSGYNRFGSAGGCSSSWTWYADQKICALSEVQVYGSIVWSSSGFDTGEACRQLDVFRVYNMNEIFEGRYPWLRDVASSSSACYVNYRGYASYNSANIDYCVAALILFA